MPAVLATEDHRPGSYHPVAVRARVAGARATELEALDAALGTSLLDVLIEVGRASCRLAAYLPLPSLELPVGVSRTTVLVVQDTVVAQEGTRVPALHIGIALDVGAGDFVTFVGDLRAPTPLTVEAARATAEQRRYRLRHYADEIADLPNGQASCLALLERLVPAFESAETEMERRKHGIDAGGARLREHVARLSALGIRITGGESPGA